ncbi:MAG: site-specific DNA-methyltransferase [Mycoplasma sp.]|nr:site-specific DNA-methyltransferase [Mycoplasma sp.]
MKLKNQLNKSKNAKIVPNITENNLYDYPTVKKLVEDLKRKKELGILEGPNFDFLIKLIKKAESENEIVNICTLGTDYYKTGLKFSPKLEIETNYIHYFEKNRDLSFKQQKGENNKLIIGDNYHALQNLLISHRNKIDIIYIDPPYGCNDMGEGAKTNYENEHLSRNHLLSSLKPRLTLAKQLLSQNGVIFCSIDDKNQAYVKCLFDDVFGERNFISNLVWEDKYTTTNDKQGISSNTDYILCYSKIPDGWVPNKIPLRQDYIEKNYKNPDNDPNGPYMTVQMYKKKNPKSYEVVSPSGKKWTMPWNFSQDSLNKLAQTNQIWWGKDGNSLPRKKVYLKNTTGVNPTNLLFGKDVGYSEHGGNEIEKIFNNRNVFKYPKPVSLIKFLLKISSNKTSLILDFYAGSGTTGQAVLELNKEDNGKRRFILCTNNENNIAYSVTYERCKRVMTGKSSDNSKFKWIDENEPLDGSLDVIDIKETSSFDPKSITKIDEAIYDFDKHKTISEHINWVCQNFDITTKKIEE